MPDGGRPAAQPDPASSYLPPQPPAVATPIESNLPKPAALPDTIRRAELAAGQAVTATGLYFMDLATGNVEGWQPPADQYAWPKLVLSAWEDHRWITAQHEEIGYLIRRGDGAVFQYDPRQVAVVPGPGVFLVRPQQWKTGDGGRCALLDENMKLLATFTQQDGCRPAQEPRFSPEGKVLAVVDPMGDGTVSLVTTATGAVKVIKPVEVPSGYRLERVSLTALPATGELVVNRMLMPESGGGYKPRTRVGRYTWEGQLHSEALVDGYNPVLSRDGRRMAYNEYLGHLGSSAVVREWGTEQPLFRVAGGSGAKWVAGTADFLVSTYQGFRLISGAGGMQPSPLKPDGERVFNPFNWLTPSPDNPDRFLSRGLVLDRSGGTLRELRVEGQGMRVLRSEWGPTAVTAYFFVGPVAGKGWDTDHTAYIAPKVQRPPYPDKFPLQVEDAKGECLNLRTEASASATLIRCLPTGTRLDLAGAGTNQWLLKWNEQWGWVEVVTEKGEKGWIAISTGSVTYAN